MEGKQKGITLFLVGLLLLGGRELEVVLFAKLEKLRVCYLPVRTTPYLAKGWLCDARKEVRPDSFVDELPDHGATPYMIAFLGDGLAVVPCGDVPVVRYHPDVFYDKSVRVGFIQVVVIHLSAPFGQEGKDIHEWERLEMHCAVGEVNHRPSRSLGVGVNTDKEGAWFVMLSVHTLEWEIVSWLLLGRCARGWCWLYHWRLRCWLCLELWLLPRVCDIPRIHLGVPASVKLSALDAD